MKFFLIKFRIQVAVVFIFLAEYKFSAVFGCSWLVLSLSMVLGEVGPPAIASIGLVENATVFTPMSTQSLQL